MSRTRRFAGLIGAAAVAVGSLLFGVLPAVAATPSCVLNTVQNCQSINDFDVPAHALQAVSDTAGSRLVAVTPSALSVRQDFTVRHAVSQPFTFNIKAAPNGVQSNLCLTQTGAIGSHPQLEPCTGATNQHWRITVVDGPLPGWNITNALTGAALTHVPGHGVQVRNLNAGTAGGKRWDVQH